MSGAIYSQCGLRLRSALDLHLPVAPGDGWDVDITVGPELDDVHGDPPGELVAELAESPEVWWYRGTRTAEGYVLRFRDRGDFVVSTDLAHVEVRAARGTIEFVPVLLAGTVLSFVLALRGSCVLHASAVAFEGTGLAFVGHSGGGKSTTATLLCLDGAALVTDDVLVVDPGPPVTGIGGSTELRLRDAARHLGDTRPDTARRVTADERLALSFDTAPVAPVPLAAIIIPVPSRTAGSVEVTPIAPSSAVFTLLAFPRIHGWRLGDVLRRDFDVLSAIVNRIPVYGVTIPWGPPFSAAIAPALRSLAMRGSLDGA